MDDDTPVTALDGSPDTRGPGSPALDDEERGLEAAIQFAKKYLEDLLSFFGLNTTVYATSSDDEVIELNVPTSPLNGFLIGQRGDTMRALQFMISNALRNQGYVITRINVDVADYKKARAGRLADKAGEWLKEVGDSGQPMHLQPMNAADRRTIHKLAGEAGLQTHSEGLGPDRHIVLSPAPGTTLGTPIEATQEVTEPQEDTDNGLKT